MAGFDHKRPAVYSKALRFVAEAHAIAARVPRARWFVADQLLRAATSIVLNLAEGAGEFSDREKVRFYRMARRSAAECAAILDCLTAMALLSTQRALAAESRLAEIAAMLTRLIKNREKPSPSPSPSPKH